MWRFAFASVRSLCASAEDPRNVSTLTPGYFVSNAPAILFVLLSGESCIPDDFAFALGSFQQQTLAICAGVRG
jgi:hypothetical protein